MFFDYCIKCNYSLSNDGLCKCGAGLTREKAVRELIKFKRKNALTNERNTQLRDERITIIDILNSDSTDKNKIEEITKLLIGEEK